MNKLSHSQLGELVVQVQQGDEAAFAALYAATVEKQLYFATAFLKDASLAEDAVQEVYLSLYKNIGKLKKPQTVVAYLNHICYNACVDMREKALRLRGELGAEDRMRDLRDESVAGSPSGRYDVIERNGELLAALDQLEDDLRSAFLMRYYSNMKIRQIAQAMACSESTVKRYVKAAAAALKELLPQG